MTDVFVNYAGESENLRALSSSALRVSSALRPTVSHSSHDARRLTREKLAQALDAPDFDHSGRASRLTLIFL